MKGFFWVVLLLAVCSLSFADEQEPIIVELTDATFDDYIKSHPVVMMKFYGSGCTHCRAFAPEYESAAKTAHEKQRAYKFGQLEVNLHTTVSDKHGVGALPVLKLFVKGQPMVYNDQRESRALLNFLEREYTKLYPSTELKLAEELLAKTKLSEMQAILAYEDPAALTTYIEVAKTLSNIMFYHAMGTVVKAAFPEVTVLPAIIFLKDFDERRVVKSGSLAKEQMLEFIEDQSTPRVASFNTVTIAQLFKPTGVKGVVLFRSPADPSASTYDAEFHKLATAHRAKDLLFIIADPKDSIGQRVAKMLALTESSLPDVEILETKGKLQRQQYKGPIVAEKMGAFLLTWREAQDNPVHKVPASSFKKEVLDCEESVLVNFCFEAHHVCREFSSVFTALAKELKANKAIKLVEVDPRSPPIEGHSIESYPSLKLFVAGSKGTADRIHWII